MADLSPAAQAVLDAYIQGLATKRRDAIAAALRAVADQVVPDEPDYMRDAVPSTDWWDKHDQVRSELLSLANELEGQ
jgi:hypothetical protein